jgi:putative transposase
VVTPAARREAVAHLKGAHEVSERRACAVLGVDRSSVRYRSRRSDDSEIRARIRDLAARRRRFGYRRLHFLLSPRGSALTDIDLKAKILLTVSGILGYSS